MSSSSTASSEVPTEPRAPVDADASGDAASRRYALTILGAIVLALVGLEAALRLLVVPVEEGWAHRVDLVYRASNPDAVLGDSHFFRGFVTQDEFTNLAGGGSSPEALEIVAREYFRFVDPGRVIVAASPQLFTRARAAAGAQEHDEYFGQNHLPFRMPFQLYVFEPGIARAVSWLRDPGDLLERAAMSRARRVPGNGPDSVLQRKMAQMGAAELRAYTLRTVAKNRPVDDLAESPGFASYRRLLDFLVERGARVCVVRTAVTPLFEELTRDDPDYVAAHRLLRETAKARGLRYVDSRAVLPDLGAQYFIDADHLAATGSAMFSQAVIRACYGDEASGRARPVRDQLGQ